MESKISERAIDDVRPLKVIYIGAGVSGILACIQFPKHVPGLELVVYEKNEEVGGTWFENRYPGCACDIPAHAYQLSFESSTDWSSFYAEAPEILRYWQRVADKYNVRRFMKFRHQCTEARWDEETAKWHVTLLDLASGQVVRDVGDVLMTGVGALNRWEWPEIPGLHDFQGKLMHSADWDAAFDPEGKSVAVIGAGSSGIQIVPALLPSVASMDHYVRGRTWISPSLASEFVKARNNGVDGNFSYTDEERAAWKHDRESYISYRKSIETEFQGLCMAFYREFPQQVAMRELFAEEMRRRLQGRPDLVAEMIPDFAPLCKRLTPGPGYLESLVSPKVNVVRSKITAVNATGIITDDGVHRPVDAIVCATGFRSFQGSFPVYGRGGRSMQEHLGSRPRTYLSICTDGFPNFFQTLGPNSGLGAGNLVMAIESATLYVARVLRKLATENVKTIEPRARHVDSFTRFCDEYHARTVYTDKCASWYKAGRTAAEKERGAVIGVWPGSGVHLIKAFQEVRWEDFEMETVDGNDFGWFGNGLSGADRTSDPEGLSWYLNDTNFLHENQS
ncbi:flavin-binding monooxygenase [Aspergillus keveii]|uniref:Flavin-binding monooxygenase n=1 Tax=Aspergillus keveii TaxID=714993 RepID=A0ABR4GK18_9EURO